DFHVTGVQTCALPILTVTDWVFLAVAAVTLFSAYRVVVSRKIMHAALWLGLTFFGVAGIFLLLGADFLAAAQVLVYVGAVTTIKIGRASCRESADVMV